MRTLALFAGLTLAATALGAEPHAGLKKRVAVMDMAVIATTLSTSSPGTYTTSTSIQIAPPADFALGLTEMLTTELFKTDRFIVLERKALADVVAEQDLGGSDRANKEVAITGGDVIGAQALIHCAVTEYAYTQSGGSGQLKLIEGLSIGATVVRAQVGIDVRIFDSSTTEVLASTVARGTASSRGLDVKYSDETGDFGGGGFASTPLGQASRQAIAQAVAFIVSRVEGMPWEARIIRARENQIYINAGAESGITAGTTFKVFHPEETLVDPASGLNLGTPDREVGRIRVASVQPKYAVAELIEGDLPQRNDVVRPQTAVENP